MKTADAWIPTSYSRQVGETFIRWMRLTSTGTWALRVGNRRLGGAVMIPAEEIDEVVAALQSIKGERP